jgi:hypothetical protein
MDYILIQALGGQTSEQRANSFSMELYKISRPVRDKEDVTTHWFGIVKHPITGDCALQIPDLQGDDTYIHPQVNLNRLRALLNPSLADPGEVDNIVNSVNDRKGGRIRFFDLLPTYSKSNIRDQDWMDANGWFPKITMP